MVLTTKTREVMDDILWNIAMSFLGAFLGFLLVALIIKLKQER